MGKMSFLFNEYPQIFAIVEELSHYSAQVVIPTNTILDNFSFTPIETNYPSLSIMTEVLDQILSILETLSPNFLFMMLKKHR